MSQKSNIAFSLDRLSKSYDGNTVLQSVDLSVSGGTIIGLVGKNGAGKTTLIKCLLGLLRPDSGESLIFGESSWNLSARTRHRIGYVPQTVTGFRWMIVDDFLQYIGSFYQNWNHKKVRHLVKEWEIPIHLELSALSEGQRQKLAIIQAMGHEPDLYILDEPVASLDPVARRQFIKQLIELNISENRTVLFSTHITSDLERVAADIAILKDGAIRFHGDLAELKEKIVRLHIQSHSQLPDPFPLPNIIRGSVQGSSAVLTVDGVDERQLLKIEKDFSAAITKEHLSLEDIFLELNK